MAEVTSFGYRPGQSLLHRLDARFKLLFLVLISLASLKTSLWGLLLLSGGLLAALPVVRLSPLTVFRELRWFLFLLAVIFLLRLPATPGTGLFSVGFLTVTREGILEAVLVCGRMLLIVCVGILFTATSRPAEIRAAVQSILKPVPGVPAARVATMMSLIMRFIPVIFDQAHETAEAQRARGVELRKNPLYRLTRLGIPLARRTFESADRLIVAMESRCYNESRTGAELSAAPRDWVALLVTASFCMVMMAI